jgi:hypothetical protein
VAERAAALGGLAGRAKPALAGDHDAGDPEVFEVTVDRGLAVATIGGGRPWCLSEPADDPGDGGHQQRRVGGVADV